MVGLAAEEWATVRLDGERRVARMGSGEGVSDCEEGGVGKVMV